MRFQRPYEQIVDEVIAAPVSADNPSDEFKRLTEILDGKGCAFPKQQAALMLRNTPGAARALLEKL